MSEAPEITDPAEAHNNPAQPYLVLGGTAVAFFALGAVAVLTRHPLAIRGAFTAGSKLVTAAAATGIATGVAFGIAKALESVMPGPITGLQWRRYQSPEQ